MHGVILCGGSGTRLWPLSRNNSPKQFLKLFDEHSFFQKTILRIKEIVDHFIIVSNKDQYFIALEQLQEIGVDNYTFIVEAVGKNTAPSIAFAALTTDPNETLLVLPSDHIIKEKEIFHKAVFVAQKAAQEGHLVTFGIKPTAPKTGYGYIEAAQTEGKICDVLSFKEKPDLQQAKKFLAASNFYWNSGMFLFTAQTYLQELQTYAPSLYRNIVEHFAKEEKSIIFLPKQFMEKLEDISIDYAVMEHSKKIKMVPLHLHWSDIGDFDALYEALPKDANRNVCQQNSLCKESRGSLVYTKEPKKIVATLGIEDLYIIDTPTALLVAKKGEGQKVKEIVNELKKTHPEVVAFAQTVHRPWGKFTTLYESETFKVKHIVVYPGHRLSLQKHLHRSEHWVVVSGTARVQVGEKEFLLSANQSTYVPCCTIHRLHNPGKKDLEIIEVQVGEYLGEDDIIRLEDDYARA